ncbi:GNAT family N-acetyltransferase [Bradyrhizobium elkanii]|nr:GNAT family N-acetyltransferase [Bradyrhizobium elkanii]
MDWLNIDYRTLFQLRNDGRIERENDPDHSPGPRFWLAGCAEGNIFGVRDDLPDDVYTELESLAANEPAFTHPATPRHLDRYLSLFNGDGPVAYDFGLIYDLPHSLSYRSDARTICSDSAEGRDLMLSWATEGVPEGLFELGFREVADFWEPWCVATVDGQIASVAFAARLSDEGAELGLVTAKAFRGQGLGAATTAGWSRHPALQSRTLFYSTDRDNISSQHVAERLGLRLRGASLRIS